MKCISCGNLIPDVSTICPYCNNKVEPVAASNPVYNVTNDADQTVTVEAQMGGVVNNSPMQTPPINEANTINPVNPIEPVHQDNNMAPVEMNNPVVNTDVNPVTPPEVNASSVQGNTELQREQLMSGAKIASGAPIKDNKNGKQKIIIIAIIAVILLVLIGGGVFFYLSQYKSVDKRIDTIVNVLFSSTNRINTNTLELASGSYSIDATLNANENEMKAKINGKYAYDLESKLIDITLNAEEINLGENMDLIPESTPLSIELYTYDSKAYILLQNFYENYISMDIEGYDELFAGIEQNDIDYNVIINGTRILVKQGLKAADYEQTVSDVTVNGKTSKANVIKLNMTANNQRKIVSTIYNSMQNLRINGKLYLEELAKLENKTVDELKIELETSYEELEYTDSNSVIEIYTAMFASDFIGVKLTGKTEEGKSTLVEISPITSGYKIVMKEDSKEVVNLELKSTYKRTSTNIENTFDLNLIFYDEAEKANKVTANIQVIEDLNPKAEKVNIKNSVDYRYIPTADQQKIITNISNYGNLGLLFQSYLGDIINSSTTPETSITPGQSTQTVVTP